MAKGGKNPNSGENTTPYPHFSTDAMRKHAEKLAHTAEEHEAMHEENLAKLDHGEGHEKGGR